ncbi:MAG: DNA helicase Rep [Cellvibrionales bacterium]|nr:DNA helicase Rep [Cellvibrionales bacterium]
MQHLNPQQKKAVKEISSPCLVLAGAGSGKTSVITQKIAYLIDQCELPAKHIAAVTFTNKAAKEMKERVGKLLPKKQTRGLMVSTFHTLGLTIIRKEAALLNRRAGFSIFDAEDAKSLLKELAMAQGEFDLDLIDFVQQTISHLKNAMTSPEKAMEQAKNPQEMQVASIYKQYQVSLEAYNAVDFDDLIGLPVALFQSNQEVLAKWQGRIRYLLVDEYQDTNHCQYALVKLLVGGRYGLTVVGDDDQSIYAWRGAKPENLAELQTDFPTLKLIKLEQNYRSTGIILDCANTLIQNNPHVFEKKLWSDLAFGQPIRVIATANEKIEAERIANEIISARLRKQNKYSDYAILYRSNHQARLMELALRAENIPYSINGGVSFFSRTEVKDIMAYLRLLANPDDDNAFLRIINVPRRKIGASTLQALAQVAKARNLSLYAACDSYLTNSGLSQAAIDNLKGFYQWMQDLMRVMDEKSPMDVAQQMVNEINYEAWLHSNSANAQAAERRMENIRFLLDNLQSAYQYEQEESDEATIKDAINRLILRDMMERQSEEEEQDTVQMLTMHAAKGLEYPTVFMVGVEEEILPHRNSIESDDIEEERRLAYVGITRARENLIITYANQRKQFGEMLDTTPSRFIDELPTEHIQFEGRSEEATEASVQQGKETLDGLKRLFDDF